MDLGWEDGEKKGDKETMDKFKKSLPGFVKPKKKKRKKLESIYDSGTSASDNMDDEDHDTRSLICACMYTYIQMCARTYNV